MVSVDKRNAHLSSVRLDSTWPRHGVATWPGQTKHAHAPHTPRETHSTQDELKTIRSVHTEAVH